MFQEEIAELEKGFITLIATVLSKIRAKCNGTDHVLDDDGGKFSEFFLNSAKNRLSDVYLGYVFTAKKERNNKKHKNATASIAPPIIIKTEIKEEPNIHETCFLMENNPLNGSIEQETTITQSNEIQIDQLLFFDESRIIKTPSEKLSPNVSSKSSQSQSPIDGCHADILDSTKQEELAAQKELLTTLFVTGLPIDRDDPIILCKMFLELCHHIHVNIDSKEIASIEIESVRPNEHNLVVRLTDAQQKENIVRIAQRHKGLKANDFIPFLPMNFEIKYVHIYPKLTKFYERLTDDAISYLHHRKLYSFRVCSQGLAVRCSKHTQETYIKSRKELRNLVDSASPPQHSKRVNEDPLHSFGLISPKQARV